MLVTYQEIMDSLKDYASPKSRLTRLIKDGKLIQIRRGLFVDDPSISRRIIAPVLYGPSYISFQFALAAAGLIPERVSVITSASYKKNKDKFFSTPLGEYSYLYLPQSVYPHGIKLEEESGMSYLIATPEKALCDTVYKHPSVTTVRAMEALLLEDWRMERDDLMRLDSAFIKWIAPLYRRKSLLALAHWFEKEKRHD